MRFRAMLIAGLVAAFAPIVAEASQELAPPCGAGQGNVENMLNLDTGSYIRSANLNQGAVIPFAVGAFHLGKDAKDCLDKVIAWLSAHPERKAILEGHADDPGSEEYNLALGEKRANSVLAYMTANGVSPSRLSIVTMGRMRPLSQDAGAKVNGRVEIRLGK
ncbi:exported hypothetical protein [Rhodospirillaceae bacterium LM-1]|nr:exported hypothetical protein [Rhodospirillaceae bacterium LM-1]